MKRSIKQNLLNIGRKLLCGSLAAFLTTGAMPIAALAKPALPYHPDSPAPKPKKVNVKTGPRKLTRIKPVLKFSTAPTDLEISTARVFQEPLIPMSGAAQDNENAALVSAIKAFKLKSDTEDLSAFEDFISKNPKSRWIPSLRLSLGQVYYSNGYLSNALTQWRMAWEGAKRERDKTKAQVASSAIANLLALDARLGRKDELTSYLDEVKGRAFYGSDEQKIKAAKGGLCSMQQSPQVSFKCGPLAVNTLLRLTQKGAPAENPILKKAESTTEGTTLTQVKDWADQVGLKYQMAKRSKGAPFVTPAVMHWGVEHFATIVGKEKDRYHIQDPTFDTDGQVWITAKALEQETDGYFLIPSDKPLPEGWTTVSADEGNAVHGKGICQGRNGNNQGCPAPKQDPCSCETCDANGGPKGCGVGMARADVYSMLASLHIYDTPLGYTPPVGPAINFRLDYNQDQTNQPGSFAFTTLGANWNLNWLSYLTVDSGTNVATLRIPSGGTEVYTPSGGVYTPDFLSQALLVNTGSGTYERRMKDGSIQVYDQSDASSPPRIFMTKVIDSQGNEVLIQYDSDFRITTITDSIGQVSTISYVSNSSGNPGFYKVASITDPFSRTASFEYDSSLSNLIAITDVIGLKSQFQYDTSSSFITQMTTAYGTTSFYQYVPGIDVYPASGIRITYPDGTRSVLENWLNETKSTYFWDRHAMQMYPNDPANHDYSHCELMKWTIDINTNLEASATQWLTHPLESSSPVYMTYDSSYSANYAPNNNLPTTTKRALGNQVVVAEVGGTPKAGDVVCFYIDFEYAGYVVQSGDSLEKIAEEMAKAVNTQSNYQTRGISAGAAGKFVYLRSEQTGMNVYGTYISPGSTETLKYRSQARQSAIGSISGTITAGDVVYLYVEQPYRITFSYTVQSGDTAANIVSALATAMNADTEWQNRGGVATASGSKLNVICYTQQVQEYNTGGTGTTTLAFGSIRNGSVQLSENQYNSAGNLTEAIDPVGRKFSYSFASNGIDLEEIRETQGTDNYLLGHWDYNSQHLPTTYIDGSAQTTQYTYNSVGQPLSVEDALGNTTTMTYTGTCSATVGGTVTAGNTVTITVFDDGLSGGSKAKTYTVQSGDTLSLIATGLKNAINADTDLSGIGVTASAASSVVTLTSTSVNVTSYTRATSGGATATLTLGANIWGYLTKIDGPLAGDKDVTTISYDSYGRTRTTTNSQGYVLTFDYDDMDRPTRTTYPDGTYEETIYDRLDAVMSRDRNGRWTQKSYTNLDQMAFEIDPLGRKTQYTWCSCGSLAALIDPNGSTTSWTHDIEGRLITKTYADSSTYSYVYEAKTSNLKTRTDALGQKTNYFYCNDSRVCQTSYPNPVNPTAAVTNYWDLYFGRMTKITKNDWGSYSYTYNNYVTSSGATPITGGGQLQLVHNDVIANSDVTFVFDALGRTTNRSINGSSNSIDWTYDAMSRVTSEDNALGTFDYAYVDDASGSSKGDTRLASVTYPNSQVTKYDWYPSAQDERLQQISNLGPTGATISQFSYRYDPAGQIKQWQQLQGNTSLNYAPDYDQAGQLTAAAASGGPQTNAYLKQNYYAYDPASNRTGNQSSTVTRARFTGTVTTGNVLTITVTDSGLTGGSKAINYTVQSGDS
ncbi:MAG: hypothetical protein IPP57_26145 [Candidatus Obscuribacter sp.]|nr:hypothetical protein [Candidatus Obscuribacter sp.]